MADGSSGEFLDRDILVQRMREVQSRLALRAAGEPPVASSGDNAENVSHTEQVLHDQLRRATQTIKEQQQVIEMALSALKPSPAAESLRAEHRGLLQDAAHLRTNRSLAEKLMTAVDGLASAATVHAAQARAM